MININPVAFSIFGLPIRWYGLIISSGIALAVILSMYTCKWRDVEFDPLLDIVIIAIPAGIIGARIYYVIFNFEMYSSNLFDIFNIRQGGLAIHGGIIFAFITGYILSRVKKMNFLSLADVAGPSFIIAQAIGRWGNFFNQEAHGSVVSSDFISHFPKFIQKGMLIDGVYYEPTFLYESIWNLCVFVVLIILLKKSKKPGIVFFTYLGLYSIGRFIIEGLRTDSLMSGNIKMAQLVSVIGVVLWIGFLLLSKLKKK